VGLFFGLREKASPLVPQAPLVIGFDNDVPTFDPLRLGNVFALRVGSQVFEGLTRLDENNRIVGAVAETWEHSPDFKEWTFHLRAGVKFHSHPALDEVSRSLTADDVIYSFTRMLEKDAVPSGPLASVLEGAKEYQAGASPTVLGLQVVSPKDVKFTLCRPDAQFPGRIASPAYGIVKKAVVDKAGANFGQTEASGTGPFAFAERRGSEMVLKRFKEYWGGGSGVETVIFRTVKEDAVRLAEAKAGRLSATYATEPMLEGLVTRDGDALLVKPAESARLAIQSYPVFNTFFLAFNYPKVDPDLRRAISLAVNRAEIVSAVVPLSGVPVAGPIPLACAGYAPRVKDSRDLAGARAALEAYGRRHPRLTPKIKILTNEVAQAIPIGEVLQSQLKAAGIEVELVQQSFNAVIGNIQKGDFEALVIFFEYQYSLPQLILENFFTSPAAPLPNVFYYKKPENDAAVAALFTTGDEAASLDQSAVVEKNLVDDNPGVFLYQTKQVILLDPKLQGVRFNGANFPVLTGASWK
jgi:ABC-type transport system substrate-binding protein